MRNRLVVLLLALGLLAFTAGCGSSGGDDTKADDGSGQTTAAPPGSGSNDDGKSDDGGSDDGAPKGDVDCAALKTAAEQLLSVQLMAQIRDPESIASFKSGTIGNLDFDKFLAAMETLHALDGYDGVLGDPKEAIDIYEKAATDAKALFEKDAPTQADIDAYNASIGTTGEFLGHQAAISGGLDEAGC